MNYLAHAYLSNNNEDLILGNFIADHIKGNNYKHYSQNIINGILLHRKIDHFTDNHIQFKNAKRYFYDGYEKYAGILIDIYFDYFLASEFQKHCHLSLLNSTENVYKIYDDFKYEMPKSSQNFYNYIIQNDIYNAYATLEGIEKVLFHLSHRINHGVMLNHSINLFNKHKTELYFCFLKFIVDAKNNLTPNNNGFYK